jgi:predicted phosphodiesterase
MQEKRVVNGGAVTGKLLLFGGVYSNLQALQALKKFADANNYSNSNIFCTGDILGYCAQPNECIELIKNWNINSIAGNVELQIRNDESDCGCDFANGGRCDLFSKNWYAYIRKNISDSSTQWLRTLPEFIQFNYRNKRVSVVHGSWFNTSEFIFRSTSWQRKWENLEASQSDVIIAGHCGLPFAHSVGKKHWINAGVIGMPANDASTKVWYLTMQDDDENKPLYSFHRLHYDYELASGLMQQKDLPLAYANTLRSGLWDNCEILPEEETRAQGKPIVL